MNNYRVILVAFKEFDNLGMGYLVSLLSEAGYETKIVDFRQEKEEILKEMETIKPIIVGFSVILMYYIHEFRDLIVYLREKGIKCHFTAGGHYASLRYEELFKLIPSLDSIVRFEGEYTFLEMAKCIDTGVGWRNVRGIAYRMNDKTVVNPLRPLEKDLDNFPFPARDPLKDYGFGKKFATLIAGRGCIYDCIYCNIREVYKTPLGPVKRVRTPENVVKEMELLHHEKECSLFLFQDDDFPVKTSNGPDWIEKFCNELKNKNLAGKIMWKINCRPDEIEMSSFKMMKDHGLFLVFLGIEDGTDYGLKRMNKQMTVSKSLEGINILKKLNIDFDYGFMLFQPWSTYQTLTENLDFLRIICDDGFTPVTWFKMLPFFETRIERELKNEGRLKGEPGFLDYDFLDPSINHFYEFTDGCFSEWLMDSDGLLNRIRWAKSYLSVFSRYFQVTPEVHLLSGKIRSIVSESNIFLLDNMNELAVLFKSARFNNGNYSEIENYKTKIWNQHNYLKEQIRSCVTRILNIAAMQQLSKSLYA